MTKNTKANIITVIIMSLMVFPFILPVEYGQYIVYTLVGLLAIGWFLLLAYLLRDIIIGYLEDTDKSGGK